MSHWNETRRTMWPSCFIKVRKVAWPLFSGYRHPPLRGNYQIQRLTRQFLKHGSDAISYDVDKSSAGFLNNLHTRGWLWHQGARWYRVLEGGNKCVGSSVYPRGFNGTLDYKSGQELVGIKVLLSSHVAESLEFESHTFLQNHNEVAYTSISLVRY